jgi:diamine N-acetyltransferase
VSHMTPTKKAPYVQYQSGDGGLLSAVGKLWLKLRDHHISCGGRFADEMGRATFGRRRAGLLEKAGLKGVHLDIAQSADDGRPVGYCISSITKLKKGEIESIFVESAYRSRGFGDELITRSLAWLKENGAKSIVIGVATGNERALKFYARFNFHPRVYLLAQPKSPHGGRAAGPRSTKRQVP